ncbi:hypothetical protein Aperf_G00000099928 [Anoplocephala perfoliata]
MTMKVPRVSEAYVTLATTDEYAVGAMVLANSLKKVGTTKVLVCMVTREVQQSLKESLEQVFDEVVPVNVLDSGDKENLKLLSRPDLGTTFTKLHCWRLTQYRKCVFMDADTLVVKNIDDLFEREELSAAPDPGWPDCFNSGVFVYVPCLKTYQALMDLALKEGSFDGADQGLLNLYFSDWASKSLRFRLPFTDNCVSHSFYSYPPALKQFGSRVRVVHFIGPVKPWHHPVNIRTGTLQSGAKIDSCSMGYLNMWWQHFLQDVRPTLNCSKGSLVDRLAELGHDVGSALSQEKWERGEIDYTGSDRFIRIREKLDKSLRQ